MTVSLAVVGVTAEALVTVNLYQRHDIGSGIFNIISPSPSFLDAGMPLSARKRARQQRNEAILLDEPERQRQ